MNMYQPKLYLHFDPPITNKKDLMDVLKVIELNYPEVRWSGRERHKPTEYNPYDEYGPDDFNGDVVELVIGYHPSRPLQLTYGQYGDNDYNYKNIIDGREWVDFVGHRLGYDKIDDFLTDLNEADESKEYEPKLYLYFEPPITNKKDLMDILEVIEFEYPEVYWSGRVKYKPTEYNPYDDDSYGEDFSGDIGELIVGYDQDVPNRLTYSEFFDNEYSYKNVMDGREWIKKYRIGYDKIDDFLTDLNEAAKPKKYKPKLILRFDPPINESKDMDLVLQTLEKVYPNLSWRAGEEISKFSPFDEEWVEEVSYLSIGLFKNTPDKLTYIDGEVEECDVQIEETGYTSYRKDGWSWLENNKTDYDGIYDMLSSLD